MRRWSRVSTVALGVLAILALVACAPDSPPGASGGAGPAASGGDGGGPSDGEPASSVHVEYIAHASFILTDGGGRRLLIDPYQSRVWLGYDFPEGVEADAVAVTHPHYDHDAGVFRGAEFPWPEVPLLDAPGTYAVGSMSVIGVEGKHADPYGEEFGQLNTIFVIEAGGLRIAHLGDNGPLTEENVRAIGPVDVLMIPGDALYHILSPEATEAAIEALDPSIVIPMHFRIGALESESNQPSDLGDLDPWLSDRGPVTRLASNVTTLSKERLPAERTYLVFEHSSKVPTP